VTAADGRKRVGLACSPDVYRRYVDARDVARLEQAAEFSFRAFAGPSDLSAPAVRDQEAESELGRFAADLDVLLICHGAPFVGDSVLESAARLSLLGELDGDRFAYRLDIAAARRRGVRVVDTSHGSSWPTAEWARGLALVGLRNAGAFFRLMTAREQTLFPYSERSGPGYDGAELAGKCVGMIGFGHLGRRLAELLRPFGVSIRAHDPYVVPAVAEAYGVDLSPLSTVLASDVVFVLVPHTSSTEGMLGGPELELLRPGSVFVNVSRGKVVDSTALVRRLERGDVIACLDVFDPEPVPLDSPILGFPNVFVSPHIAGVTEESRRRFFSLMVDECLRHFAGLEPRAELTEAVVRQRA